MLNSNSFKYFSVPLKVFYCEGRSTLTDSSNINKMDYCTSFSHTSEFYGYQNLVWPKVEWIFTTFLKQNRRELLFSLLSTPSNWGTWLTWLYRVHVPNLNETQLRMENCNSILSSQCQLTKDKILKLCFPWHHFQWVLK